MNPTFLLLIWTIRGVSYSKKTPITFPNQATILDNHMIMIKLNTIGKKLRKWPSSYDWRGLIKPGIGRDPVPGFSIWHFWIPVPGFDVIAITDLICFSPLAMNDRERMCIVLAGLIDLLQSIYQNFVLLSNISLK